jgi:hypothetical protein
MSPLLRLDVKSQTKTNNVQVGQLATIFFKEPCKTLAFIQSINHLSFWIDHCGEPQSPLMPVLFEGTRPVLCYLQTVESVSCTTTAVTGTGVKVCVFLLLYIFTQSMPVQLVWFNCLFCASN